MSRTEFKYIIVGQGIAGTLLAFQLFKRKIPFLLIDNPNLSSASKVAAGLINPITGRKYIKTWMYETLQPAFESIYSELGSLLGKKYLKPKKIIRSIPTIKDKNNWDARLLEPIASNYMDNDIDLSSFESHIIEKDFYGNVSGYQLEISSLIKDFREFLSVQKVVLDEKFDHDFLNIKNDQITYKQIRSNHIIFCEGYLVQSNPLFENYPISPAKGELLLIRAKNFNPTQILKDHIFIAPLKDDIYWVGASYSWDNLDDLPTKEKRDWLISSLDKVMRVPYEILDHKAGVRPSTDHRMPVIGTHHRYDNVHIFNGLGTKGSSLGPYWSEIMVGYLEEKIDLPDEVSYRFVVDDSHN